MSSRIDVVLVKLGAAVIVVLALQGLSTYTAYMVSGPDMLGPTILAFLFNFVIPIAIASVLWRFPNTLLGRLSAEGTDASEDFKVSQDLWVLGISLIGLYALVFGVIDLLFFESLRFAEQGIAESNNLPDAGASLQSIVGRVTNIAQIIFGLALILGRRRIAQFLRNARPR